MIETSTQIFLNPKRITDGYEKGRLFEDYIIKLFNEQFFYLKKWRKAQKFISWPYQLDYWNPDIEMELVFTGARKYRFAVECKWRKAFKDGKITWARRHQINSYLEFQNKMRIPVFVAIGIGGKPDSPEQLYLTPLNHIYMYHTLFETNLIPFKRKPTNRFYYDAQQLRLF